MKIPDRIPSSCQNSPPSPPFSLTVTKAVRLAIAILVALGTVLIATLSPPINTILLGAAVWGAASIEPLKNPISLSPLKPLYSPARPCRFHARLPTT